MFVFLLFFSNVREIVYVLVTCDNENLYSHLTSRGIYYHCIKVTSFFLIFILMIYGRECIVLLIYCIFFFPWNRWLIRANPDGSASLWIKYKEFKSLTIFYKSVEVKSSIIALSFVKKYTQIISMFRAAKHTIFSLVIKMYFWSSRNRENSLFSN